MLEVGLEGTDVVRGCHELKGAPPRFYAEAFSPK